MRREEIWLIAGIALAVYFVLRKPFEIAGQAAEAVTEFGGKVGSVIYDIVNPSQTGEMLYYTPLFPDGTRHAIASGSVRSGGYFTYQGAEYRLGYSPEKKLRLAVPV